MERAIIPIIRLSPNPIPIPPKTSLVVKDDKTAEWTKAIERKGRVIKTTTAVNTPIARIRCFVFLMNNSKKGRKRRGYALNPIETPKTRKLSRNFLF